MKSKDILMKKRNKILICDFLSNVGTVIVAGFPKPQGFTVKF